MVFRVLLSGLVFLALRVGAVEVSVKEACQRIGNTLSSVSVEECLDLDLQVAAHTRVSGMPVMSREFLPAPSSAGTRGKVLLLGGIHGDEYASYSVAFKWLKTLVEHHSGLFHWYFVPALNPDGLLAAPAVRGNANGVDLNRNFGSAGSGAEALAFWQQEAHSNPRKYPGKNAQSEIETEWLTRKIEQFRPDVIVALHAPLGLVDYDGPENIQPPAKLGTLLYGDLGNFPGSLGWYAGEELNIPVLTIEFASSRRMPDERDYRVMWVDLVRWLRLNLDPGS